MYALQKEIVSINNQNKIGLQLEAVCEEYNETKNLYTFRSQYDSPGVDTVIFVKTKSRLELGNYYNLKIDYRDFRRWFYRFFQRQTPPHYSFRASLLSKWTTFAMQKDYSWSARKPLLHCKCSPFEIKRTFFCTCS